MKRTLRKTEVQVNLTRTIQKSKKNSDNLPKDSGGSSENSDNWKASQKSVFGKVKTPVKLEPVEKKTLARIEKGWNMLE